MPKISALPIATRAGTGDLLVLDQGLVTKSIDFNVLQSAVANAGVVQNLIHNSLSSVTFTQSGVGAITRSIQSKAGDFFNALDYNAKFDNINDDTVALRNAIAAVPSGGTLILPPGIAKVSDPTAALTVTKPITIMGSGFGSLIRSIGAGAGLVVDGTGVVNGLSGIVLDNFSISTEAGGGDALQLRLVSRGYVKVWVPSCAGAAFHLFGCAHTEFHPQASTNLPYTAGTRSPPINGMVFDDDSGTGTASGHNCIIDPKMEGISSGAGLAFALNGSASHNVFMAGDGAGGVAGLTIAAGATLNCFIHTVFESNSGQDISVAGVMNELIGVQAMSFPGPNTEFLSGAENNSLIGGRHRLIQVDSGAVGTAIYNPSTLTAGITDNGTRTQQKSVWYTVGQTYLPERIVMPSAPVSNSGGMWALFDAANKNRTLRLGMDSTIGPNGVAYLQAVLEGTAQIPLQLNPSGGDLVLGNSASTATFGSIKPTSPGGYLASDASHGITGSFNSTNMAGKTFTFKDGIVTGFS